jgi:hypothetical protein
LAEEESEQSSSLCKDLTIDIQVSSECMLKKPGSEITLKWEIIIRQQSKKWLMLIPINILEMLNLDMS